jgi:hypothetical protein
VPENISTESHDICPVTSCAVGYQSCLCGFQNETNPCSLFPHAFVGLKIGYLGSSPYPPLKITVHLPSFHPRITTARIAKHARQDEPSIRSYISYVIICVISSDVISNLRSSKIPKKSLHEATNQRFHCSCHCPVVESWQIPTSTPSGVLRPKRQAPRAEVEMLKSFAPKCKNAIQAPPTQQLI